MKETSQKWSDLFGSEWEYVKRLGSCFTDPEEKKAFWDTVREKKLADPSWSIYTDFPVKNSKSAGLKICEEILNTYWPHRGKKNEESA